MGNTSPKQDATSPDPWTLGDRLAKARTGAGLTQEQLAVKLDIVRATVGRYENDKVENPEQRAIMAWAMATGCSYVWLRDGTGPWRSGPDGPSDLPVRPFTWKSEPARTYALRSAA